MKYSQGLSSACWKLWRLADMSSGTPSPPEFGIVAPLRLRTLLRSPCGIRRCCWDTLVKSLADERLVECFMRCRETPLLLFPLPAWSCGCWWVEEWLLTLLSADEPDSWPVSGPLRRWSEENSNTKGDIMYNHNGLKHIGRTNYAVATAKIKKILQTLWWYFLMAWLTWWARPWLLSVGWWSTTTATQWHRIGVEGSMGIIRRQWELIIRWPTGSTAVEVARERAESVSVTSRVVTAML